MKDIFISYATLDRNTAETISLSLERRGFSCWLASRDVEGGANYQESIVRAIRAAKLMLFVFSANSNNSDEVKKEIALAGQAKITVIPLRVEDVLPNEAMSYEFATRQWIDLFRNWEEAIEVLVSRIVTIVTPRVDSAGPAVAEEAAENGPPPASGDGQNASEAYGVEAKARAYQKFGDDFARRNLYDMAIEEYTRAIEAFPANAVSYHNRGNAYSAKGKFDLAINDFTRAISVRPNYASAYNNRANSLVAKGALGDAMIDFDEAIRLKPDFPMAHYNKGSLLCKQAHFEAAIREFNMAIEMNPHLEVAIAARTRAMVNLEKTRAQKPVAGTKTAPGPSSAKFPKVDDRRVGKNVLIIGGSILGFVVIIFLIAVVVGSQSGNSTATTTVSNSTEASAADAAAAPAAAPPPAADAEPAADAAPAADPKK